MIAWFKRVFLSMGSQEPEKAIKWQPEWSKFLFEKVAFYRMLNEQDRLTFCQRSLLFLQTTEVKAGDTEVSDHDCLLVAASAIIPVWGFPKWHYFNLRAVYLLPGAFNEKFECEKPNSRITGMVGTGALAGKLALSKPDLYKGFENSRDKQNVGIHEFVHLIDMADGECDGYPERLKEYAYSIPWFELVNKKTEAICKGKSNINDYATTNRAEFFAVASEYFFERPRLMSNKHPKLFSALSEFYQQDVMAIADDVKKRDTVKCYCGSKKSYKDCCKPAD